MTIYNALLCKDLPDLTPMVPVTMIGPKHWSVKARQDIGEDWPPERLMKPYPFLDSESWRIDGELKNGWIADHRRYCLDHMPIGSTNEIVERFLAVLMAIRSRFPNSEVGAYNELRTEITPYLDYLAPSFYRAEASLEAWFSRMVERTQEIDGAYRPFLWPQYHQANTELAYQFIPANEWRAMLEFAWTLSCPEDESKRALVIWGGHGKTWKEYTASGWWDVTKDFIGEVTSGVASI